MGSCHNIWGSNSMPTDTKKSTANASLRGKDSSAALLLNLDSPSIMPAKNAPKAKETSNIFAAKKAMPIAEAITAKVNSSLEPFFATSHKILGSNLLPITSMSTINALTLASVMLIGLSNSVKLLLLVAFIPSC